MARRFRGVLWLKFHLEVCYSRCTSLLGGQGWLATVPVGLALCGFCCSITCSSFRPQVKDSLVEHLKTEHAKMFPGAEQVTEDKI